MDQDQEDKIKEVVEELEKAKEALFSLYGDGNRQYEGDKKYRESDIQAGISVRNVNHGIESESR